MSGVNGIVLPETYLGHINRLPSMGTWLVEHGIRFGPLPYFESINEVTALAVLFLIIWLLPNTQEFMMEYEPAFDIYRFPDRGQNMKWLKWNPMYRWAFLITIIAVWSIMKMNRISEFLYYQF